MPKPGVSDSVIDQTNRVSAVSTYASAIVVASKKGPVNTPILVTGQTNFLQKYTPDEKIELGWDQAMMEAWIYLGEQSNLYVVRAANNALYGGAHIKTFNSEEEHEPCTEGFATIDDADFDYENDALLVYGADQGAYNNDISVAIITDPEEVKLDGCFIVRVYKNGNKVEDHVCSLDPAFKNGYGVNCYAEDVLKTSLYVRCDVNDEEEFIKANSYAINVKGTVKFENKYIKAKAASRRNHEYIDGDLIMVADLEKATAYYECTKAGRTADSDNKPSFTLNDAYLEEVEDGNAIWTLKEIVKTYEAETDYNAGDIITITKGSKVMNFRAMVSGTTNVSEPAWLEEDKPLYNVQDGTITWANLDQIEEVSSFDAYTYKEGQKDSKLDLNRYKAYTDFYLVKEANLQPTKEVTDPTLVVPEFVEKEVTYTATFLGTKSAEHYILPKASKKVAGAYVPTKLAGGDDGVAVTDAQRIKALNTLRSDKDYTYQLIMDAGNTTAAYQKAIEGVCSARKDSCHGIVSMPFECTMGMVTGDETTDMLNYRRDTLNANTYNLEMYENHQLVYDEFNDRYMYVSPSCFAAARIMSVAQEYGWHWATAGENRGVINSLDCANTHEDGVIDKLCDNQINPMLKEPGKGIMIGDDYTLLSKACDLQDAHISRYVNIYLRPRLREALKPFLFEFNDAETRNLIVKMLETFMRPEVSSRAIQGYKIVCDESNNTPRDIQNSICNCWLYIQPTKIIRWIKQKIILTPQGSDLSEMEF